MNDLVAYHIPKTVRIEVVKVDSYYNGYAGDDSSYDVRRFSVDPQATSLNVLQSIIVKAFNLRCDFTLSYFRPDVAAYVPFRSEWDLDTAFISCARPFLQLRVHCDRRHHGLPDWDIITVADLTKAAAQSAKYQTQNMANSLRNKVERLASKVTMLGLSGVPPAIQGTRHHHSGHHSSFASTPSSPESCGSSGSGSYPTEPLTEKQYHALLDGEGRLRGARELRITTFRRGVEHSLRKVVWKQLLGVYPAGLTAGQRLDYMKQKGKLYGQLKAAWQSNAQDPQVEIIHNMVKKDVLRTDRSHPFFAGNDTNVNVVALTNLLTTYALNHKVRYCQGMSDLASPLLYAMRREESHAYVTFCALMKRTAENFAADGRAMSRKFAHLARLLMYYDPEFYSYLKQQHAHELLFCYRWLLLELKREFSFDDSLHAMEVLWSSVPPPYVEDQPLYEP